MNSDNSDRQSLGGHGGGDDDDDRIQSSPLLPPPPSLLPLPLPPPQQQQQIPSLQASRKGANVVPFALVPSVATTTTGIATSNSNNDDDDDVCPICTCRYPIDVVEIRYLECCGQQICTGCIVEQQRVHVRSMGHIIEEVTPEDEQFRAIASNPWHGCPYCREKPPTTDNEYVDRLRVRIDKFNDSIAMNQLGSAYHNGTLGLPKNIKKAEQLLQRSCDLDYPLAAWNLSSLYCDNYPDQEKMEMKFLQRGETLGNVDCIRESFHKAKKSNDSEEAVRMLITLGCLGEDTFMDNCFAFDERNLITKDDLATTFRAYQAANDGRKTDERDFAKRYYTCDQERL